MGLRHGSVLQSRTEGSDRSNLNDIQAHKEYTMNNAWRVILVSVLTFSLGVFAGKSMDHWPSFAMAAEGGGQPKFLRLLGHQQIERHLALSVYCDEERAHLLYLYISAGGETLGGNLVVIKDGCKVGN